jgi:hypothetical protein
MTATLRDGRPVAGAAYASGSFLHASTRPQGKPPPGTLWVGEAAVVERVREEPPSWEMEERVRPHPHQRVAVRPTPPPCVAVCPPRALMSSGAPPLLSQIGRGRAAGRLSWRCCSTRIGRSSSSYLRCGNEGHDGGRPVPCSMRIGPPSLSTQCASSRI